MSRDWIAAPAATVRRLMADAWLERDAVPERLGAITLRPHQRQAADRLVAIIVRHGGAMLAEPVGVGKTYTALAVAAHAGGRVLVAAPASLRDMWQEAASRANVAADFVSYESLSRGRAPVPAALPEFVIADEAHRLREPGTRRYARLAELARHARVLLVTATPVHNRRDDLAAQLALILGQAAFRFSDEALARLVVRSAGIGQALDKPRLAGPHRLSLHVDDDCIDWLLALPPPIPAGDESVAAALVTFGLVHQWASSRAALAAALRRRRACGLALAAALESGRLPTRAELAAWTHAGDALQLAFPEIVAPLDPSTAADIDARALLVAVDRHNAAITALLEHLRASPDPDDARADTLRAIRRAHPGERIIAFCQYTETVAAMRARLALEPGIAALVASGGRVAGGPISRREVISQFTPRPSAAPIPARDRIDLLITTDLLSEGLDLQEASVIVHLDLPWNPARLDQRVGRAVRLGSRHPVVTVYTLTPPANAEALLRLETRLRDKLRVARRLVGVAGSILPLPLPDSFHTPAGREPALSEPADAAPLAEQRAALANTLRTWRLAGPRSPAPVGGAAPPAIAALSAPLHGFLALVRSDEGPELLADTGHGIASSPAAVSAALQACAAGIERPVSERRVQTVMHDLEAWLARRRAGATIDLGAVTAARVRRAALTRVARALARAPRHRRSALAPLADAARAVASAQLPIGAERILETLVDAPGPDEAWLRSIAAFGEANARGPREDTESSTRAQPRIVAILLFGPNDEPARTPRRER